MGQPLKSRRVECMTRTKKKTWKIQIHQTFGRNIQDMERPFWTVKAGSYKSIVNAGIIIYLGKNIYAHEHASNNYDMEIWMNNTDLLQTEKEKMFLHTQIKIIDFHLSLAE